MATQHKYYDQQSADARKHLRAVVTNGEGFRRPQLSAEQTDKLDEAAQRAESKHGQATKFDDPDTLRALLKWCGTADKKRKLFYDFFAQLRPFERDIMRAAALEDAEALARFEQEYPEHAFVRRRREWTDIARSHGQMFVQELSRPYDEVPPATPLDWLAVASMILAERRASAGGSEPTSPRESTPALPTTTVTAQPTADITTSSVATSATTESPSSPSASTSSSSDSRASDSGATSPCPPAALTDDKPQQTQ